MRPAFPPRSSCCAVTATGQTDYGMAAVGEGKATAGSRRSSTPADKADARPLWVSVWGGANTLAQALSRRAPANVPPQTSPSSSPSCASTPSPTRTTPGRGCAASFPDLFYIVSPSTTDSKEYWRATWTGISGDRHYRNGPGTSSSSWTIRGWRRTSSRTTVRSARSIRGWPTSWKATRRRSSA